MLAVAAAVALAQASGRLTAPRWRFLWPGLLAVAGAGLLAYLIVPHHGLDRARDQWAFVFGDAQQRQHVFIATLFMLGFGAELLVLARRVRAMWWRIAWPAAVAAVGVLFVVHQQHGTSEAVVRATLVHRCLGALLVLAGLLAGADVLRARRSRALAIGWTLALVAAAGMLLAYREPEGAYHGSMDGMDAGGGGVHPRP